MQPMLALDSRVTGQYAASADPERWLTKMKTKKMGLIIAALYLITWLPAVFVIRHERKVHSPMVYPVIPFIVLACDKQPSIAGEWSIYASSGFGVKKLFEIYTWIE